MADYKPKAGKKLLEMFMFKTYSDARMIYREYIQNAIDAINDAVRFGVLESYKEGFVSVTIDKNNRCIKIKDNGIGIEQSKAEPYLKDLGNSRKDANSAGYYGIGRFMGAGFCDTMTFRTSAKGEDKATELAFDVRKIWSVINDPNDTREATQIIADETAVYQVDCSADEHFFEVVLEGVNENHAEALLEEDAVVAYLRSVAPVPFSTPFESIFKREIPEEYKDLYGALKTYNIVVNDGDSLTKTYKTTVSGSGFTDSIDGIVFFKIESGDSDNTLYAWGWHSMTKFSGQLVNDENRGLRLRCHNITVGDANILGNLFSAKRSPDYFVGELHIVNENLVPNTERSNLANTEEKTIFEKLFTRKAKELTQIFNAASDMRTANRDYLTIEKNIQEESVLEGISENDYLSSHSEICDQKEERAKKVAQTKKDAQKKLGNDIFNQLVASVESDYNSAEQKQVQTASKAEVKETKVVLSVSDVCKDYTSNESAIINNVFLVLDGFKRSNPQTVKKIKEALLVKLKKNK